MKIDKELPFENVLKEIGQVADSLGYECYVVGGYVRDLILSNTNDDIDIVVVGKGLTMAEAYAKHLKKSYKNVRLATFENFGTAQVKFADMEIEFVGARKESYERGSRKPVVEEGTLHDDLLRRDFTINAMAIRLNSDYFGELIDPFNGMQHLKDKVISTPVDPDITFSDDPLRQLRAVRFAAKLGFIIDTKTIEGIRKNVSRLSIVSAERISTELMKIMESKAPGYGIQLLQDTYLLKEILPEVWRLDTDGRRGDGYKDVHKNIFKHTLEVLDNICLLTGDKWLRLAALLHDIGKMSVRKWTKQEGYSFFGHEVAGANMVDVIFKRLKLPLDDKLTFVRKMVRLHMRPQEIASNNVTDSAVRRLVFDAAGDIDSLLLLAECDITTGKAERKRKFIEQYEELKKRIESIKELDFERTFQPCVSGNDIMQRYNLEPGKKVGELKQYIKDLVLDGKVKNEPDALYEALDYYHEEMTAREVFVGYCERCNKCLPCFNQDDVNALWDVFNEMFDKEEGSAVYWDTLVYSNNKYDDEICIQSLIHSDEYEFRPSDDAVEHPGIVVHYKWHKREDDEQQS